MALPSDAASPLLRRGLLWLAGLTTVGIIAELALERHWSQPLQLVAWPLVAACAVAIGLLVGAPSRGRVRLARALAVFVLLGAAFGIYEHVYANYDAGELDGRYADTWDKLGEPTRWWLAISKTVGPSPPLAPGALAQAAFCILLSTVRHPALGAGRAVAEAEDGSG